MIYKIDMFIILSIFLLISEPLIAGSSVDDQTSKESEYYVSEFSSTIKNNFNETTKILSDSNLIRLQQALILSKIKGDEKGEANTYNQIGDLYSHYFFNDSALVYFKKALKIGINIDYKNYFPGITQKIANKYWDIGEYYLALESALLLKEYYEKEKILEDREYLVNLLGIIYSAS